MDLVDNPDVVDLGVDEAFRKQVKDDFNTAKNALSEKHDKFSEFLDLYHNRKDDNIPRGLANAPVPLVKEAVNVVVASMVSKLFANGNLQISADVRPLRESLSANQITAEFHGRSISNLIRYQSDVNQWKRKIRRLVQNAMIFGVAPAKIGYCEISKTFSEMLPIPNMFGTVDYVPNETEKVIYSGPDLITVDPFDFFPHPAMVDIDDDLPIIHRFRISPEQLIEKSKFGYYKPEAVAEIMLKLKEGYKPEVNDANDKNKKDRLKLHDITYGFDKSGFITCYEWQGMFDINGDGLREPVIGVLADIDEGIIIRLVENPYKDKKKTWVLGKVYEQEGVLWGIGIADAISPQQKAATDLMNSVLNAYYKYSRRRTYIRSDAIKNQKQLEKPYGVVEILDEERPIQDCVMEETPITVGSDAAMLLQMQKQDSYSGSGVPEISRGVTPGQKTTATASNLAAGQGTVLFEDMLGQVEDHLVLPICDKAIMIDQQFIDTAYAVRILGDDGYFWQTAKPEEIAGQVYFRSLASQRNTDRQIKAEQIMRGLQVSGGNPMLQGVAPMAFVEWWKAMDLPNLETVKMLVGYYVMMQQMIQAQQMQMTPAQVFAMQGVGGQGGAGGQPDVPYQTGQEAAPTNQEEMIGTMNASMTQNSPTMY